VWADTIAGLGVKVSGPDHMHVEVGGLVLGRKADWGSAEQVTLFRSVGVAADEVAARAAVLTGEQAGLDTVVPWQAR